MVGSVLSFLISLPLLAAPRVSEDGRYRWEPGSRRVEIRTSKGRRTVKIARAEKGALRTVLFAPSGRWFAVLDETRDELGLHLDHARGSKAAKATVVSARLRLIDERGRTVWDRELEDRHLGGSAASERPIRLSTEGTLAILLQDADPLHKNRPRLLVFSPSGEKILRLDYTQWTRIDGFALSSGGKALSVRGLGRRPKTEDWGPAASVYDLGRKGRRLWSSEVPSKAIPGEMRWVSKSGWACCLGSGPDYRAFDPSGGSLRLEAHEVRDRFGPEALP